MRAKIGYKVIVELKVYPLTVYDSDSSKQDSRIVSLFPYIATNIGLPENVNEVGFEEPEVPAPV